MTESGLQPIIVIGMHRSGTSLLARLLSDLGVHMGADCNAHNIESQWMLSLNEFMLASVGATWHKPQAAEVLVDHDSRHPGMAEIVRNRCRTGGTHFTGHDEIGLFEQKQPWGWKDPRTTLTLPVWLSIFPEAKVIEIVRNGVDVVHSLVTRERKDFQQSRSRWLAALREQGIGGRILHCSRTAARKLRRPNRRTCPDLEVSFSIWADYLAISQRAVQVAVSAQHHRLRFEDLLQDPKRHVTRIQEFIGQPAIQQANLSELAASIRSERGTAFAENTGLRKFYEKVRHHALMIEHGYANLI